MGVDEVDVEIARELPDGGAEAQAADAAHAQEGLELRMGCGSRPSSSAGTSEKRSLARCTSWPRSVSRLPT